MDPQIIEELKGRLGMVIGGRWKLIKILGLGASAGVYRGVDDEGWRVAVKVMHSRFLRSKIVRQRFLREQSILDQVQHRHTLRIYETSETLDGLPYIVMELLEGQTLARIMSKRGEVPLEVERVISYTLPMLEALELCHGKQILHRDLKPANVFLTQEGVIKLLDFGVARYHQDGKNLTRDGATIGTPSFMSPEQAQGRMDRLDARSDLFSVGAMMHYLLSGQYIHEEETAQMTYLKAATTPAPSLERHAPHLSGDVVALVDRAVAWNPEERWQSAAEFSEQLRRVMELVHIKTSRPRVETEQGVVSAAVVATRAHAESSEITEAELVAFWHAFERALDAVARHGSGATMVRGRIEECEATLQVLIKQMHGELSCVVHPYGMNVEGSSEAGAKWRPPSPLDEACYLLSSSGVRRIRFFARHTVDDLTTFLHMLVAAQHGELGREEDLATAIWSYHIVGIEFEVGSALGGMAPGQYEVMDHAFAAQLDAIGETLRSEFALESERINVLRAIGAEQVISSERLLDQMRRELESVQVHEDDLLTLRTQHRKQRGSWARRLGTVMSDVVQAAHHRGDERVWLEPLGQLAIRLAEAERVEEFMSLLAVMLKRLTLPQARRSLGEQAMTPQVLRALFVSLGIIRKEDQQAALNMLDGTTLETLTLLLGHLDMRHLEVVLEALASSTQPAVQLRQPLLEVVRETGSGHQATIGRALKEMPEAARSPLVTWLQGQGAPGLVGLYEGLAEGVQGHLALELIEAIFATPHNYRNKELVEVIEALSWHERAEVRRGALALVTRNHYEPFLARFLARPAHQDFHVLSMEERRENFAQLRALSAPGAEQACVLLLALDGQSFSQERISSQLLAIEDLARHGYSQEAMNALDEARRAHPQRPREVQHAAQQAFSRFCARHGIAHGGSGAGGV